jgi:hypothetical protein
VWGCHTKNDEEEDETVVIYIHQLCLSFYLINLPGVRNPTKGTAQAELKREVARTTVFVQTDDHSLVHS